MTREEAIKIYNTLLFFGKVDCTKEELEECFRITIKALEQEPKPMIEIDLYSVIKQKYIEREVLDKIRAEIKEKFEGCDICEWLEDYDYEENNISEYQSVGDIEDILQIIDKYKAESGE